MKVKDKTCWFCTYWDDQLKDSPRCKKCLLRTKDGFKQASKIAMKRREEE